VAIVDGVEINAAEFNHALDTARVSYEEEEGNPVDWSTPDNQKTLQSMREDVLEGLINYQVVAEQAQKENITATPDEIQARLDDFKQQLGGPDAYQSWISRRFLADEDQRKAITQLIIFEKMEDRHSQVEDKAEQVHLRHIQLQTEAEAKQIYDKLRAGADFAALARQFSLDITTASRGGDLDFIFPGQTAQYGPDFERVAFSLKTNEISGPVKTPIGYHILQSLGKEVRPLPFDLVQQRKEEAFEGYIKTLRDKAKIEKKL
jgi:parvulin-like peptidyl-prolyl isomerase